MEEKETNFSDILLKTTFTRNPPNANISITLLRINLI